MSKTVKINSLSLATLTTGICLKVPFDGEDTARKIGGQPIWTHQLGRFVDSLRPHVKKHLPDFPGEEGAAAAQADFEGFTARIVERWGEEVELPMLDVKAVDPATEFEAMTGEKPAVIVG